MTLGEAEVGSTVVVTKIDGDGAYRRRLMDMGVEKLFVTLNRDGVYYRDSAGEGFIRPKKADIVSATGAGDSFSAAIIMGMVEGMDTKDIAAHGMAASAITMESSSAVNQNMSKDEIERRLADV